MLLGALTCALRIRGFKHALPACLLGRPPCLSTSAPAGPLQGLHSHACSHAHLLPAQRWLAALPAHPHAACRCSWRRSHTEKPTLLAQQTSTGHCSCTDQVGRRVGGRSRDRHATAEARRGCGSKHGRKSHGSAGMSRGMQPLLNYELPRPPSPASARVAASLSVLVCGSVYLLGAVTCIGVIKSGASLRAPPADAPCLCFCPVGVRRAEGCHMTGGLASLRLLPPCVLEQPRCGRSRRRPRRRRSWSAWSAGRRSWSGSWDDPPARWRRGREAADRRGGAAWRDLVLAATPCTLTLHL